MKLPYGSRRHRARSIAATLLWLICNGASLADTYDPATNELTMPAVTVGAATYFNMVVTVAGIVSGPAGGSANGSEDAYDTTSGQLTIPAVTVGSTIYTNVVATVRNLVSIGGSSGADTYSTSLAIPYVQVGGAVYNNVVVTVTRVVNVRGGMPANARDVYDSGTQLLTIAAVQFAGNLYTNIDVTIGAIQSVGSLSPQVTLTPSVMYFSCIVTSGCAAKPALLINTGATTLGLSNIALNSPLSHAGQPVFAEVNNCHTSLGPGQSCALSARFGGGDPFIHYSGKLSITDGAAGSPQTVALYGYSYY